MTFYITKHITNKVHLTESDAYKVSTHMEETGLGFAEAVYELDRRGEINVWDGDYDTVGCEWDAMDIMQVEEG